MNTEPTNTAEEPKPQKAQPQTAPEPTTEERLIITQEHLQACLQDSQAQAQLARQRVDRIAELHVALYREQNRFKESRAEKRKLHNKLASIHKLAEDLDEQLPPPWSGGEHLERIKELSGPEPSTSI